MGYMHLLITPLMAVHGICGSLAPSPPLYLICVLHPSLLLFLYEELLSHTIPPSDSATVVPGSSHLPWQHPGAVPLPPSLFLIDFDHCFQPVVWKMIITIHFHH